MIYETLTLKEIGEKIRDYTVGKELIITTNNNSILSEVKNFTNSCLQDYKSREWKHIEEDRFLVPSEYEFDKELRSSIEITLADYWDAVIFNTLVPVTLYKSEYTTVTALTHTDDMCVISVERYRLK